MTKCTYLHRCPLFSVFEYHPDQSIENTKNHHLRGRINSQPGGVHSATNFCLLRSLAVENWVEFWEAKARNISEYLMPPAADPLTMCGWYQSHLLADTSCTHMRPSPPTAFGLLTVCPIGTAAQPSQGHQACSSTVGQVLWLHKKLGGYLKPWTKLKKLGQLVGYPFFQN